MINFTFNGEDKDKVINTLIDELNKVILSNNVQTLAANHYDTDEERIEALKELVSEDNEGFVFDEENKLGEEPYGFVYDFFCNYVGIIEDLKKQFPKLGIEGFIAVNEHGPMDWVHQNGVYATAKMKEVKLTNQLQCVVCYDWVNPKDAACEVDDEFDFSQLGDDWDPEEMPEEIYMAWGNTMEGETRTCLCRECKANIEVDI